MVSDIDKAFPTRVRPRNAAVVTTRKLSRFETWSWSPIISFQIGLTAGYVALLYFGISALIESPPSLQIATPFWYQWIWSLALAVGSIFAAIGSVSRAKWFERVETVGASLLTLTLGSYAIIVLWLAYELGDTTKIAGGAGFTALAIPVIVRTMWLFSQLLRK